MTEYSVVLLACLAIVAVLAVLIYASSRNRVETCELRRALDRTLDTARHIEAALDQQRRVLYDAHKKIHAVSKGLQKPFS